MTLPNKDKLANQIQGAITGITKHLTGATTVTLNGTAIAPTAIIQTLQNCLNAINAAASAAGQYHAAVLTQNQLVAQVTALLLVLRSYVVNLYGKSSPVLSDFGMATPARQKPTVLVKAQAVLKLRQTRELRNTKGKRQKADLKVSATSAAAPGTPVKA